MTTPAPTKPAPCDKCGQLPEEPSNFLQSQKVQTFSTNVAAGVAGGIVVIGMGWTVDIIKDAIAGTSGAGWPLVVLGVLLLLAAAACVGIVTHLTSELSSKQTTGYILASWIVAVIVGIAAAILMLHGFQV